MFSRKLSFNHVELSRVLPGSSRNLCSISHFFSIPPSHNHNPSRNAISLVTSRTFGSGVIGGPSHTDHVRFCNGTNGVGTLQLNRPDELDALSETMAEEILMLTEYFDKMGPMQLRCLILTGSTDQSFSVGRDLKISNMHETSERRLRYLDLGAKVVEAVHNLEVPTIASIEGKCMGWGLELALACDIRMAAPNALFSFPETKLGIFPGAGGVVLLQEVMHTASAKELVFTGRELNGIEAAELGLVNRSMESPLEEAYKTAASICENGPLGVRAAKKVMNRAFDLDEEAALEYSRLIRQPLSASEDFEEALSAFTSGQRRPKFKGR